MRVGKCERITAETKVNVSINLDGDGKVKIDTGMGFLDHMLTLFAVHGGFDLDAKCNGDLYVDAHHSAEDIGIALGKAFNEALSDKRGIRRYGSIILPMDEALILTAIDISGRAYLSFDASFPTEKIGEFDAELIEEFMRAFSLNSSLTLHIKEISGRNSHHIAEAIFKSLARALREAVSIDKSIAEKVPSSKGVL